jgi:UPF0271 protein
MSTGLEINCDLGERTDTAADLALMPYVDAVNIACTYHAGNVDILQTTANNARSFNLKIGAHPGFKDRESFGRKTIIMSPSEIKELLWEQLALFQRIAGDFAHVKPHGALYTMSATRQEYARAIAEAVFEFNPTLEIYGLSGSLSLQEAERIGLKAIAEGFADRAYTVDGNLSPRQHPGAVLKTKEEIGAQYLAISKGEPVLTLEKKPGPIVRASTICVHSDTDHALSAVRWLNELTHR